MCWNGPNNRQEAGKNVLTSEFQLKKQKQQEIQKS